MKKVGNPRLVAVKDLEHPNWQTSANLPKDIPADQRDFLLTYRAADKDSQAVLQIMGHFYAGKPWTPQMSLHLNSLMKLVVHGEAV